MSWFSDIVGYKKVQSTESACKVTKKILYFQTNIVNFCFSIVIYDQVGMMPEEFFVLCAHTCAYLIYSGMIALDGTLDAYVFGCSDLHHSIAERVDMAGVEDSTFDEGDRFPLRLPT